MKKLARIIVYYVIVISVLLSVNICGYGMGIISISHIRPGMKGIGKTVFKGTKVEDFHVKVIDVIEDDNGESFIFVKLLDERFSRYGSIVAGMSGSPIYFNGKLAGALAYGWKYTKGPYGLVVPIGKMLKVKNRFFTWQKLISAASYISVSGIGERGYKYLKKALSPFNVRILSTGISGAKVSKPVKIEPGSAVSVDLAMGDLSISAIGTLTYRDKDFFLAFGHPIFRKGDIDFLFSSAYIFGIVPNLEFPFKLGVPVRVIGKATQDRGEGIGGYIGKYPKVISVIIEVRDKDYNSTRSFSIKSVRDEELFPIVLLVSILEGIDKSINRIGKGTSKISISFNRGGESIVKLKDMFWSREDIAAESLTSLRELIYELEENPFEKLNFDEVKVRIDVTKEKHVGYIEDVVLDKDKYKPGELIRAQVRIKPYRKPPFSENVAIRVPDDFPYGSAYLLIRGGDVALPEDIELPEKKPEDLEEFIKELTNREKNNSLVVELYSEDFTKAAKKAKEEKGGLTLEEFFGNVETKKAKRVFDMDMIIDDWVEKEVFITSGKK